MSLRKSQWEFRMGEAGAPPMLMAASGALHMGEVGLS